MSVLFYVCLSVCLCTLACVRACVSVAVCVSKLVTAQATLMWRLSHATNTWTEQVAPTIELRSKLHNLPRHASQPSFDPVL